MRDEVFRSEYTEYLTEVISRGHAEIVPQHQLEGEDGKVWYIPHHGVHHPKKGTLRVVFDCGAAFKGTSLNSELLQGPDLTSTLFGVITRFRLEPVAVMADIKTMFHQVKVSSCHVDFMRFLWWPGGDVGVPPVEHRMLVHIFGAVSSPSCANFALRQTAKDHRYSFRPEVANAVENNFYVDDFLRSLATEQDAEVFVKDVTALCEKGGFHLTKWISNSRAVLSSISEGDRANEVKKLDLDRDKLPMERALGLLCHTRNQSKVQRAQPGQSITLEDILTAEKAIVVFCQKQTYSDEMEKLRLATSKGLNKRSSLQKLDPVLKDEVLRVGGRLQRSAMPEETKRPMILPKHHHVSTLILRDIHERLGHAGRNHMLSQLRKRFWVVNANSAARKVISQRVVCKRVRGKFGEQKMADLPKERVRADLPPFSNVGVDYFGPFETKRGRAHVKRYGVAQKLASWKDQLQSYAWYWRARNLLNKDEYQNFTYTLNYVF
ncbi:hypothetical protein SRHO_G00249500 [Serrasalmus rhombeus]